MDARRPGRSDPAEIVRAAREGGATTTFGSPAIWRRVVPWALANGVRLPSTLRRVLVAGAPVEPALVEGLRKILADGAEVHTPYGQTEALPLASISGAEILACRERVEGGHGNCVGRAAPGAELAVIAARDEPIARWSDALRLRPGELGEICARAAVATRGYADDASATAAAKIADEAGSWHRTGDLGYFDGEGLLWFCGRKSHRLETERGLLAPVPTENVLNRHPKVVRTALVGVGPRGRETPVVVVEPAAGARTRGRRARERFSAELAALLATRRSDSPPRAPETMPPVLFRSTFPVDARHNAKIRSEELKRWAEAELA
jgi:acyl-CoA synthetase (AMP-forming)/AMP-acid ligase II